MTTTLSAPPARVRRVSSVFAIDVHWAVPVAAAAVVILRLPFVTRALSPDEAGYLTVAAQWHAGGTSLYGDYWVDRPPLLLMLFQVASALGGTVALRVLGVAAAASTVVVVGTTARRLAGDRAGALAAVAAAAWLVNPIAGSMEVDGELLAAPFVAVGIAGVVRALDARSRAHAVRASFVAGLAGAAAVLVKQNMLDVLVFAAAVALLGFTRRRRVAGTAPFAVLSGFVVGAAVTTLGVAAWTVGHGTSLAGVWYAMYPFRAAADAVMAAHPSSTAPGRALELVGGALGSGLAAAVVVLLVVLRRLTGLGRIVGSALVVVLAYDAISSYLGGNYWIHYLVQLVVPAALAIGLATAVLPRTSTVLSGLVALIALASVLVAYARPAPDDDTQIGTAIRSVARPSDSIVTVFGHSGVTHASGLRSPYPYLWSLPTRTLDPDLAHLTTVLRGADAPTWFVSSSGPDPLLVGADTAPLDHVLARRYREVADLHGAAVYLLDGVHRGTPELASSTTVSQTEEPS